MESCQKMNLSKIMPIEFETTVSWCSRNVYLSSRIPTSEPGQWKAQNVVALTLPGGPLEACDDNTVETVVVVKGSQTALTTTTYCWLAHCLCTNPSSALIVMNSSVDAKEKSAETWRPMWEDSPLLKRFLPVSMRKEWTKLYQLVNRSPVYWVGANSSSRLASKPIRRLILDEIDKYPQALKRETGAAELARQRTKAYRKKGMAKIIEFSTPTGEEGEISLEYLNGDQRQLHVPCPMCGALQVMVWANFKIDMRLADKEPGRAVTECHYECPHCKGKWNDEARWGALAAGVWKPTVEARDPKCRSFRLPSWCSTFVTHSYLAAQWLRAQKSTHGLQDFINSECAEPFVKFDNAIRDSVFSELEGQYDESQIWTEREPYKTLHKDKDVHVFGGVDVQKGYLVATFRAFTDGGDSAGMWAGEVPNFETLDDYADRVKAEFVLVDNRYRTQEVNEWCAAHTGYIPAQGVTRKSKSVFWIENVNIDEGKRGQRAGRVIETISHNADQIKNILADQIQKAPGSKSWLVPRGYAGRKDYCEQMTAEKCINGKWVAIPAGRPNHYWDAECLCLLAALRFQVFTTLTTEADEDESKQADDGGAGA